MHRCLQRPLIAGEALGRAKVRKWSQASGLPMEGDGHAGCSAPPSVLVRPPSVAQTGALAVGTPGGRYCFIPGPFVRYNRCRRVGRAVAGRPMRLCRGKSGLHRAGRWRNARRGDPTESGTETIPPAAQATSARMARAQEARCCSVRGPVRVKRCVKSAPAAWRHVGWSNPVRSKPT